jgi:ubiquitin-conjugating enzyme E2 D/E
VELCPHAYNANNPVILGRILPDKEPYCFASFLIEIKFPPEYPFKEPETVILDPIYYPNIGKDGRPCCCWIAHGCESWRPTKTLVDLINAIINTVNNPNFDHSLGDSFIFEYQNNDKKFYETALEYTLKYGRPHH